MGVLEDHPFLFGVGNRPFAFVRFICYLINCIDWLKHIWIQFQKPLIFSFFLDILFLSNDGGALWHSKDWNEKNIWIN